MEITVKIMLSADPALLSALAALTAGKPQAAATTTPKKTAVVKDLKPAEDAGQSVAASTTTESQPATSVVSTTHTLESLRAIAVPKSKAGKKDIIKKWISDHDYPSLDSLQPVHFDEFFDFLQTLN